MKIGYARVSTVDQNEARQMEALREDGVDRIYMDKKSGKDFNRPEYQKMISELHKGDVLVIHSIDRLGRNYEEIITEWRKITKWWVLFLCSKQGGDRDARCSEKSSFGCI